MSCCGSKPKPIKVVTKKPSNIPRSVKGKPAAKVIYRNDREKYRV